MVGGHLFRQNSHVVDGDPVRFGCIQNVVDLPSRLADRKCCQWCRACDCPFQDLFESLYGRRVRHSVQVAGHKTGSGLVSRKFWQSRASSCACSRRNPGLL